MLSLISDFVFAENWPQWRGVNGPGISHETGLPTEWSEGRKEGDRLKAPLPPWGCSTPAIWGDAIFLTSQTEDGKLLALRLSAVDGKTIWTKEIGAADTRRKAEKHKSFRSFTSCTTTPPSPVTDGKTVVVHFGNGDLAALTSTASSFGNATCRTTTGRTASGGGMRTARCFTAAVFTRIP